MGLGRKIGAIVGGLLGAVVIGIPTVLYGLFPRSNEAPPLTAPKDPESIQRGRYLAEHVAACAYCHTDVDPALPGLPAKGPAYAGMQYPAHDTPFGQAKLFASNLTPSAQGLGAYSDGEFMRAVREGIGHDGRTLIPMMPYSTYGETLSREDVLAIAAYLRTQAPSPASGTTKMPFPISMVVRTLPKPVTTEPGPAPATGTPARGEWLLKVAGCGSTCHSSPDEIPYVGGQEMDVGAQKVRVPNITSDTTAGIGRHTDAELKSAIFEGKSAAGVPLRAMPTRFYAGFSEEDKSALVAALRKVPANQTTNPK